MTDKYYAEIFNHSGASYHQAMELFPKARAEEFLGTLSLLRLEQGDCLLDVPAGGGYLKSYLGDDIDYLGLDFSAGFVDNKNIIACSEANIPIDTNSVNKAVSLAAMHHVQDKTGFIKELSRCLVPNGVLVIGDVLSESKEASFLNGFVNRFNSLGHNGNFIDVDRDIILLNECGFSASHIVKNYRWHFQSETLCLDYLRLLFALDKQPTLSELANAINKLGVRQTSSGFHLNWSLSFLVAILR